MGAPRAKKVSIPMNARPAPNRVVSPTTSLAPDTNVYWCSTCGAVAWQTDTKHIAIFTVYCPNPDWGIKHFSELDESTRAHARVALTPCSAENPGNPGHICNRYAGHKGKHTGTVPPIGRQRKPRACRWRDGDTTVERDR